jgi:hypothetical protein
VTTTPAGVTDRSQNTSEGSENCQVDKMDKKWMKNIVQITRVFLAKSKGRLSKNGTSKNNFLCFRIEKQIAEK